MTMMETNEVDPIEVRNWWAQRHSGKISPPLSERTTQRQRQKRTNMINCCQVVNEARRTEFKPVTAMADVHMNKAST
jgi:hypothetical protein